MYNPSYKTCKNPACDNEVSNETIYCSSACMRDYCNLPDLELILIEENWGEVTVKDTDLMLFKAYIEEQIRKMGKIVLISHNEKAKEHVYGIIPHRSLILSSILSGSSSFLESS